jgi:Domain of unknown function (DUF4294)
MTTKSLLFWCFLGATLQLSAQQDTAKSTGLLYYAITETGDTVFKNYYREVVITAPRQFKTTEEYKTYLNYRKHAATVQPYASKAIKVWRQMEADTRDVSKRERKRIIKEMQDRLFTEFEADLKDLNRTQGYILIKMIEREMHQPFYDIVKDAKGFAYAQYWLQFSKIYGFNLKEGYMPGQDQVLDAVLSDFEGYLY